MVSIILNYKLNVWECNHDNNSVSNGKCWKTCTHFTFKKKYFDGLLSFIYIFIFCFRPLLTFSIAASSFKITFIGPPQLVVFQERALSRTSADMLPLLGDKFCVTSRLPSVADEMRLVKDKRYGAVNTSVEGNWDGIIGELVRRVSVQQGNRPACMADWISCAYLT